MESVKCKKLIYFTTKQSDSPIVKYLAKYKDCEHIGNILARNKISGKREFEKYIDIGRWFNEEK